MHSNIPRIPDIHLLPFKGIHVNLHPYWIIMSVKAIIIVFLGFLACTSGFLYGQKKPEFLPLIENMEQFNSLMGKPNTSKFSEVEALKVLYQIGSKKTYYINSSNHDYHSTFCQQNLGYPRTISDFNLENYTRVENRAYLMATINRFFDGKLYTIEFSVADNISVAQIEQLYQIIRNTFQLSSDPKVFINTSRLRALKSQLKVPTIEANEIFTEQSVQLLHEGTSYGILRQFNVDNAIDADIHDIAVIQGTPAELAPVSGVITTDFQTPLSHITLLCKNRGTPIVSFKDCMIDSTIASLWNKPVRFKVTDTGYQLSATTEDSIGIFWKSKMSKQKLMVLKKDTTVRTLIPISKLSFNDISKVGGKAANFGTLNQIIQQEHLSIKVPEDAIAIPIYFYEQHIRNCGANRLIERLIELSKLGLDPRETNMLLDTIQSLILNHPIQQSLLKEVENWVITHNYTSFRFRSSTNAEDLEGFNGAGLYLSKTGYVGNPKKSIEKAIKTVWASAWGFRPFMERSFFGIDQSSVGMGVLCHRNFDNELANGVVITKNLYRPDYRGFVINAQYGETSVVIPPDSVICEQVICYSDKYDDFLGNKSIVEYLSYSNILPAGVNTVLSDAEIVKLTRDISVIKQIYYTRKGIKIPYYDYGLDLEFKVVGSSRTLYLKQIRPFND